MESTAPVWQTFVLFHLPNYLLSVVIYSMFGRFMLGFLVRPDSKNYIYRWFRVITDPFVRAVTIVTPSNIGAAYLPLVSVFWLMVARLLFFALMYNLGLVPKLAPAAGS
ncbi:MAG: YggT family protein [Alphaproteobacteria bacterium]